VGVSDRGEYRRPAYQRSFAGLVGALIVVFVVVLAWQRLESSDDKPTPISSLTADELANRVRGARADGKLQVRAPATVPDGWRVRAADYQTGSSPHWHLALLTDEGRYVGVEEARDSEADLVEQVVDEEAKPGAAVDIGGQRWSTWTDAGGDYGVVLAVTSPTGEKEHVLVVGTAPEKQIRAFAASLSP
jgi:hypothetical protein